MVKAFINGTGDEGDYGLYTVGANNLRWTADQQVYVLQLNVSSASTHFQQGINTVIVPRAIALDCQLNYTLSHLTSIVTSDPLYGASFGSADTSKQVSSANIVAIISANLTGAKAETLLSDLTHNHSGGRIGNNVTISASNLYTLHLPRDILSAIPQLVNNAGSGSAPSYFDPFGLIVAIVLLPYTCLAFIIGAALQLGTFLVDVGMKIIAGYINAATQVANAVKAVVDTAVNVLQKFVDWVIEFVESIIQSVLSILTDGIRYLMDSNSASIASAGASVERDLNGTKSISIESKQQFEQAALGPAFIQLVILVIAVSLLFKLLTAITNVFSFLVDLVVGLVITYLISEIIGTVLSLTKGENSNPAATFANFIKSSILSDGGSVSQGSLLETAIDFMAGVCDVLFTGALAACGGIPKEMISGAKLGIVLGFIGIAFGLYVAAIDSLFLNLLGLMLSGYGLYSCLKDSLTVHRMDVTGLLKDRSAVYVLGLGSLASGVGFLMSLKSVVDKVTE